MNNSKLEARIITDNEFMKWDELVNSSPQGTVFHRSDWIQTSARGNGVPYELVGIFDDEMLIAGCPLYFRKIFKCLPIIQSTQSLSPHTGILLPPQDSMKVRKNLVRNHEIMNSIRSYLECKRRLLIYITNTPELHDIRPFTWNAWRTSINYRYVQPIPFNNEGISRGVKVDLRKAEKNGIEVKQITDINKFYDDFWSMTVDTYRKQNMQSPESKEYLYSLIKVAVDSGFGDMWVAYLPTGEPISGRVVLWEKNIAHFWTGSTYADALSTGVRTLFNYELFKVGEMRGVKKMNYMSGNMKAFSQFVAGFNPVLEPYYTVSYAKSKLVNLFI